MQAGLRSKRRARLIFSLILLAVLVPQLQAQTPLQAFKDYFVTGDYAVGSVGLRGLGGASGLATGTIRIPDNTVGTTGTAQVNGGSVPAGADIVAAYLYWQTVESSQAPMAGQKGYFNSFPIVGFPLPSSTGPVSWSSGGCVGASNGTKTLQTYRADVRPYLKLDANGEAVSDGNPVQYEVKLPDSGSNGGGVPLTLGATLVLVYRVLSPSAPLTSVILYDGVYAPNNSAQTFTQPIAGIYQAGKYQGANAVAPVARITHIVGNGQANKLESVQLNGFNLTSLYSSLPPFPGFYNSSWDSPTWIANNYGNVVKLNDPSASTSVLPSSSNTGCVVWGAIVMSTNVKDKDNDGLLDTWEDGQGYTDAFTGHQVSLPGASSTVKDMFVEVDYLSNLDGTAGSYLHSHLPKQAALDKVGDAFNAAGIKVHFDVGNNYQTAMAGGPSKSCGGGAQCDPYIISKPAGTGGNAVSETSVLCTSGTDCPFPGTPTVGWKGGLLFIRNHATDPTTNIPLGNFQVERAPSYRYVLFGHALGVSRSYWGASIAQPSTSAGKLVSISVANNVGTVTLQSVSSHFLKPGDPVGPDDPAFNDPSLNLVTVEGALATPELNGSYTPSSINSSDNGSVVTTTFTIPTTNVPDGIYTATNVAIPTNERWLGVAYGGPTTSSGHSDLGGADSVVTFGLWPADDPLGCQPDPSQVTNSQSYCNNQVGSALSQAGTLMHELGHPLTLTHGGAYYANQNNTPPGPATYGLNCKPNFLSVMNYMFQVRGFPEGGIDYSGQVLQPLAEGQLNEGTGLGTSPAPAHLARWYAPPNAVDLMLGDLAGAHCDGTPITDGAQMVRVDQLDSVSFLDWNNDFIQDAVAPPGQDVNFNGVLDGTAHPGFNDWANVDLRQLGARQGAFGFSGSGSADIRGGSADIRGGSADIRGGSADIRGGSADIRGGAEVDFRLVNSTVDAPTHLVATWVKATKSVNLSWTGAVFGQIRAYNIYRMVGIVNPVTNPLTNATLVGSVPYDATKTPALPTTFSDTTVKTNVTYTYYVTAALGAADKNKQSGPSNRAPVTTK